MQKILGLPSAFSVKSPSRLNRPALRANFADTKFGFKSGNKKREKYLSKYAGSDRYLRQDIKKRGLTACALEGMP